MSIDTSMYREVVVHVYNGILLSDKKEYMWVSSREVDEPRACYTEWSKLEREKQISYVNTYIRNLENRYWWTYLQGRGRDADVENRSVNTRERGGGTDWGSGADTHTTVRKWTARGESLCSTGAQPLLCDSHGGGREAQEGEDIRILTADSLYWMAETNNTVKQLSSN